MKMDGLQVRYGEPADIHGMMDLALLCTEENGLLKPSVPKILNEMWASLNHDHGLVGIIGETEKPLEAGILLRIDTMPYSDEVVLCERAIFVRPEFRRADPRSQQQGGRASQLCEFAKKVADRLDMPLLIGVLSSHRVAGKIRLYQRHFGDPAGAYWLYGAKTGHKQDAAVE